MGVSGLVVSIRIGIYSRCAMLGNDDLEAPHSCSNGKELVHDSGCQLDDIVHADRSAVRLSSPAGRAPVSAYTNPPRRRLQRTVPLNAVPSVARMRRSSTDRPGAGGAFAGVRSLGRVSGGSDLASASFGIPAHATRKASKSAGEHSLSRRAASPSQVSGCRQLLLNIDHSWRTFGREGPATGSAALRQSSTEPHVGGRSGSSSSGGAACTETSREGNMPVPLGPSSRLPRSGREGSTSS